jgi:hypothetical protein
MRKLTKMLNETDIMNAPARTEVATLKTFTVSQDGSTGAITAAFTPDDTTDEYLVIEATKPLPLGKFSVKSEFRQIKIQAPPATGTADMTDDYNAKWPQKLTAGYKAYFRAYLINPNFPFVPGKLESAVVESTYPIQ